MTLQGHLRDFFSSQTPKALIMNTYKIFRTGSNAVNQPRNFSPVHVKTVRAGSKLEALAAASKYLQVFNNQHLTATRVNRKRKQPPTLTHSQQEALHTIILQSGVVPVSEWCTGSGKWKRRRTLPAFCEYVKSVDIENTLRGEIRTQARRLLKKRPRITEVVAVTNLRAARRVLRAKNWIS